MVDADAKPCLVFRALCMRFFEGDTGAAALPMVKAGCVLASGLGKAAEVERRCAVSAVRGSMPVAGLRFALPVKVLSPARLACCCERSGLTVCATREGM